MVFKQSSRISGRKTGMIEENDIIYKPLIDDMTWSYSRLSSYESCPYMWKLTYIDEIPKEDMFYTKYGSLMHEILQEFLNGKDESQLKTDFVIGFTELAQGGIYGKPKINVINNYLTTGLEFLNNGLPQFAQEIENAEIKCVEKRFYFKIKEIKFVGICDLVIEKDNKLILIDHKSHNLKQKSGRKKPTVADGELDKYLRQLYLYSQPLYEAYGRYPEELWFNCFRTGTIVKERFNEKAFEESCKWAKNLVDKISNDNEFEENYSYFFCNYICDKHESCWMWEAEKGD